MIFCGVLQPPAQMPYFWRAWMYPLTPLRWYLEAQMSNLLESTRIRCEQNELTTITPPPGQTCDQYLAAFTSPFNATNPVGIGYYETLDDGKCGYCQYRYGTDYLAVLNGKASDRFRDIGIFIS